MGADYSFYVKFIATYAPAFLGYNNSVLARVSGQENARNHFRHTDLIQKRDDFCPKLQIQ